MRNYRKTIFLPERIQLVPVCNRVNAAIRIELGTESLGFALKILDPVVKICPMLFIHVRYIFTHNSKYAFIKPGSPIACWAISHAASLASSPTFDIPGNPILWMIFSALLHFPGVCFPFPGGNRH